MNIYNDFLDNIKAALLSVIYVYVIKGRTYILIILNKNAYNKITLKPQKEKGT